MQVEAAEAKEKQMVLINPRLKDMPSHSGIMGVRGREGRLALADSFRDAYHFRLLFFSGSYYPIMGAMRYEYGGKWQVRPPSRPVWRTCCVISTQSETHRSRCSASFVRLCRLDRASNTRQP